MFCEYLHITTNPNHRYYLSWIFLLNILAFEICDIRYNVFYRTNKNYNKYYLNSSTKVWSVTESIQWIFNKLKKFFLVIMLHGWNIVINTGAKSDLPTLWWLLCHICSYGTLRLFTWFRNPLGEHLLECFLATRPLNMSLSNLFSLLKMWLK